MKHILRTLLVCTAVTLITSCGNDIDVEKRNAERLATDEGFDFAFDLTSSDSKKLVESSSSTPCIEPTHRAEKEEEATEMLYCDDLYEEFQPKVLVKVTLKTKYKNKWHKREKIVELGYEGTVVFKKIRKGSQGLKVSLSLVDIIHGLPDYCETSGVSAGSEPKSSSDVCDLPVPMPAESGTIVDCYFRLIDDEGFKFDDSDLDREPGIPGLSDGNVRNIKAKAN